MASLEESNCHSLSDSFSLYERYLRSFNVVDNFVDENINQRETTDRPSSVVEDYESSASRGNIDLSAVVQTNLVDKQYRSAGLEYNLMNAIKNENFADKESYADVDTVKIESTCNSSYDNSSTTADNCLNEKSQLADLPLSSEDSKPEICKSFKQPIFISSTMENSNNAVDSVLKFRDVRPSESVFKLPIRELSFNGTIKHVQKLKPIVDPLTALSSSNELVSICEKSVDQSSESSTSMSENITSADASDTKNYGSHKASSTSDDQSSCEKNCVERAIESTGDSQYEEFHSKKYPYPNEEGSRGQWNTEQSSSSFEASFDSGVRSPDMFSDEDETEPAPEPFWNFLTAFEAYDKKRVQKSEKILQGVLPPPSVTVLKTDVTEMLKRYYCFLPAFTSDAKPNTSESNSMTPTKRVSFINIPIISGVSEPVQETAHELKDALTQERPKSYFSKNGTKTESDLDTSVKDNTIDIKMCTELEAIETPWPEVFKGRHYDVYYNVTKYSEKFESLALRYGERFVGAETDSSVNIHSGGLQSPSSACKRKALRLAQAKSPGRRLSHLARRRQTFCSAATIGEKAQSATSKMVLIDKNYFPHRKLISQNGKSPRKQLRRTPGKKTPVRKTPGKKTPAKTPKTRSGGSSRKKIMRRLVMDDENVTRSQPRDTLKRALFVSPEGRRNGPVVPCSSVPTQAMKPKRALFGSPAPAETKSSDGSQSDQFLKRKRDELDDEPVSSRSKVAKSLSFGGGAAGPSQLHEFGRRASEACLNKSATVLRDNHKQKLLWAVSAALAAHGWRMSSPGFREKASSLARLTRKLLTLPPHAAKMAAPTHSTSDTLLKIARIYVFAIIQGRTVEDCFEEEKTKLANEANSKLSGYISASAYQQLKAKQAATSTFTSQIKENTFSEGSVKQDPPKITSKNILQDKLVNIDTNSNSSSGLSMLDRSSLGLFKSNSMPSFEEAAKLRARRQISFDNVDFPKR